MKKLMITVMIIALTATAVCTVAQTSKVKKTGWEEHGFKGKMKSRTTTSYLIVNKFGEITKGEILYSYAYKYDDKGNCIECCSYNSDGSLRYKEIYKYDDKGNQIESCSYNSDGSLSSKQIYKYDDKGNWVKEIIYKGEAEIADKITEQIIEYYE
jgi:hypothetical protein